MSAAKGQVSGGYWAKPWVRWISWAVLAVALYGLLLGVLLPKLVQHKAPGQFGQQFHGQLSFDRISFNPFTWELNLANLAIEDEQDVALGFEHLYLNLSPMGSLVNRQWQVQAIMLTAPKVRMVGENIAENNLSAIFTSRQPVAEKPALGSDGEPAGMPALVLENLEVIDGWIHMARTNGNAVTFSDWDLSSPSLALQGEDNVIDIKLEADKGGLFHLVTHVAFEPLKLNLDLDIERLLLTQYWPFVQELVNFQFYKGQLDGQLQVTVTAEQGTILEPSQLVFSDLGFSRDDAPLLSFENIKLDGLGANVWNKQLTLETLHIRQPQLFANLTEQGLDLQTLVGDGSESAPEDSQENDALEELPGQAGNALEPALPAMPGPEPDKEAVNDTSQVVAEAETPQESVAADSAALESGAEADEPANQPPERIQELGQTQEQPPGQRQESPQQSAPPQAQEDPEQVWTIALSQLVLESGLVSVTDQRLQETLDWRLLLNRAEVKDFGWPAERPLSLAVDAELEDVAKLGVEGQWHLASSVGELQVLAEEIDLTASIPYWQEAIPLELVSGWISVSGRVNADLQAEPLSVQFDGEASSRDLLVKDRRISEDLLAWQKVTVTPIQLDTAARSLAVETLNLEQAFARIVIAEDGDTNLSGVTEAEEGAGQTEVVPSDTAAEAKPDAVAESGSEPATGGAEAEAEPWQIRLDTIQFTDSAAFFADNTLTPKFATGIEAINGTILGLNSSSDAKARVDITGAVDKYAPVSLSGEVQPLAASPALDLALNFDNLQLTSLNAYSGTYAGYYIEQGLMDLDLRYALADNKLQGSNRVVMDQLTLGQRSNSDKATSLPVALAVALMKDANGVIDLGLDVSGDLDDPEFAIGPLIGKAFVNVITKVVTSPFSLLASLVPDGEAPQEIQFLPGSAELAEAQQASLQNLIGGLNQRPGLALALKGAVDPDTDGEVLKRERLQKRLQLDGTDDLAKLKPAYNLEFGSGSAEALVADKEAALASRELLDALLTREALPDSALAELAAKRAASVRSALVGSGLPAERVFLKESRVELDRSGRKVVLSLDARS